MTSDRLKPARDLPHSVAKETDLGTALLGLFVGWAVYKALTDRPCPTCRKPFPRRDAVCPNCGSYVGVEP